MTGHRAGRHAEDLFRFGTHLGLAFQLLDDILDWEGKNTGKPNFLDLHETKLNAVGVMLVRKAGEMLFKLSNPPAWQKGVEKA